MAGILSTPYIDYNAIIQFFLLQRKIFQLYKIGQLVQDLLAILWQNYIQENLSRE